MTEDRCEVHDVVCQDLHAAGTRTFEMKRKARDAHDRVMAHWDRRATKELETFEEDLNDSLGRMGQLVKPRGPPMRCRVESWIASETKPSRPRGA